MKQWRDLISDPPELNKPILVTDGETVFFGRIARDFHRCARFEGMDLEEACNYGIDLAFLTGWKPATGFFTEKTADTMFQELGYQKVPTRYARSGCAVAFYEKDNGDHQYTIEAVAGAPGGDIGFECRMDGRVCAILGTETKACAQLLREMEESK